jgi:hypothetical protein
MERLTDTEGENMDWLHLMWDIAAVWASCAGCLAIFIEVLKAQRK